MLRGSKLTSKTKQKIAAVIKLKRKEKILGMSILAGEVAISYGIELP